MKRHDVRRRTLDDPRRTDSRGAFDDFSTLSILEPCPSPMPEPHAISVAAPLHRCIAAPLHRTRQDAALLHRCIAVPLHRCTARDKTSDTDRRQADRRQEADDKQASDRRAPQGKTARAARCLVNDETTRRQTSDVGRPTTHRFKGYFRRLLDPLDPRARARAHAHAPSVSLHR